MTKLTTGVYLSDVHFPYQINLDGVFAYIKELRPDIIILGGDIVDAEGTYGVDGWSAKDVEEKGIPNYERDAKQIKDFISILHRLSPKSEFIFLEGNHEDRYQRMFRHYPTLLDGRFKFQRDGVPSGVRLEWVPYGNYESFYRLGDTVFMHGTLFPDAHAKKMAYCYTPNKVVYGHLHDFQAYTIHNGDPSRPGRYAVTAGCLCGRLPDYKKGLPNKWTNGFVEFACVDGVTTISTHQIEKGRFVVKGKLYGGTK
jgi:predicted phosphodiesterase